VIFEDSAALIGIVIAAGGIYLTEFHAGPGGGAYWDGVASIFIGLVLAVVAFVLARTSRGLLLGEAANPKSVRAIVQAIAIPVADTGDRVYPRASYIFKIGLAGRSIGNIIGKIEGLDTRSEDIAAVPQFR